MKSLLIILSALFLTACNPPTPMSDGTATAFQSCMDKGWKPHYFSNGIVIELKCHPRKAPIPMSKDTKAIMEACLTNADNSAVYNPVDGMVMCVDKSKDIQVRQ